MSLAASLPVYDGYFADPFVTADGRGGFVAVGTNPHLDREDGRVFEVLRSNDLRQWRSVGAALERLPEELGSDYWAPEITYADGRWWLFYSVGHDIVGHHLRVAVSDEPHGPYVDIGVNLTPDERFAIDPHPFQDVDGAWYLFFARDVLGHARPGTHLAMAPLIDMRELGGIRSVLTPFGDQQIYQRRRQMYGGVFDWHTLEGPSVIRDGGRYFLTFSGGAWTGPGYGVSWSSADAIEGPWVPASTDSVPLLRTSGDVVGPGHNSVFATTDGQRWMAFHAWDPRLTARRMHIERFELEAGRPRIML
ncbi:glycoside hydrolase family 43 protein [Microbacterium sp.]|uniref:glycoside hydrolase family 43 protein n=1 Tax=Microbacterium sp. TaxID=51671 RepID=UPI003F71451F